VIAQLLIAPSTTLERAMARDAGPRWRDVLAALSAPTSVLAAALAFSYAGSLLVSHFVANLLFVAASFAIQSFAAALVGRVLYGRSASATLHPFALTLVPQELLFVALTGLALLGVGRVGAVIVIPCLGWNVVLTSLFFRAIPGFGTGRAVLATCLHYATIALLVGLYAHAQDLLPYPAGVP
jgi:hypothetical protein